MQTEIQKKRKKKMILDADRKTEDAKRHLLIPDEGRTK